LNVQESVFILLFLIDSRHESRIGRNRIGTKEKESLFRCQFDAFTNHIVELTHGQIRRYQIFLLVNIRNIRSIRFLANNRYSIGVLGTNAFRFRLALVCGGGNTLVQYIIVTCGVFCGKRIQKKEKASTTSHETTARGRDREPKHQPTDSIPFHSILEVSVETHQTKRRRLQRRPPPTQQTSPNRTASDRQTFHSPRGCSSLNDLLMVGMYVVILYQSWNAMFNRLPQTPRDLNEARKGTIDDETIILFFSCFESRILLMLVYVRAQE
jgi:hypothetical protein